MSEGWVACDALVDESWNRFGGANIEFMYGGGLTANPYRVYVCLLYTSPSPRDS